ncbi:MAG: hypothetical protein ABI155_10820 [Paralcaligenes sp.]
MTALRLCSCRILATHGWKLADSTPRELAMLGAMVAITLWLGLYPQPVLDTLKPALEGLRAIAVFGETTQ